MIPRRDPPPARACLGTSHPATRDCIWRMHLVRTRVVPGLLLAAAELQLADVAHAQAETAGADAPATWEAFAVRYATIPSFRVAGLVAGADTARRLDIAMMVWLLRGPGGRTVLVDAGFQRPDLIARWKPTDYVRPDAAVQLAGVEPAAVTDLIVTHVHWDHFDGADLFPNARLWIQRAEVEHHVDAEGRALDRAIDGPDARMLHALRRAGRLQLVDGDAREIIPGITVFTGGKHTFESQYAAAQVEGGRIVIASDNAYLYENLDRGVAIAQTLDAASNLAAQRRMRALASEPRLVIPGHDPAVFDRFPSLSARVVRLR